MKLRRAATYCFLALCAALPLTCAVAVLPAAGQQLNQDELSRFQLAEKYLDAAQYERAISLLEELHEAHPDAYLFFDKLARAYENSKQYERAITLMDQRLKRTPTPALASHKAHLLYLDGQEEAAFTMWDEAVGMAPNEPSTYQTVTKTLTQHRLFERAISILKQGRSTLGQPDAFRMNLAYLYTLTSQHEQAVREYVGVLRQDEGKLGLIKSRIMNFGEGDSALKAYISGVEESIRAHPQHKPTHRLMAWLHLQAGNFEEAFEVTRTLSRLRNGSGNTLLEFARQAMAAEAHAVAAEAYADVIAQFAPSPLAAAALLGRAAAFEEQARAEGEQAVGASGRRRSAPLFEKAVKDYREYLQLYPNGGRTAEALQRLGSLQQDVFQDLAQAKSTLEQVVESHGGTKPAYRARLQLADIALARGKMDRARLLLSRLADELESGEELQRARYELAMLHFYEGEFEAAKALLKVINTNTSTDVANDAIALRVMIHENAGPDSLNSALVAFSKARLLQARRQPAEAARTYQSVIQQYGRHPIVDDARYYRAEALLAGGSATDAYETFMEIPLMYPSSTWADQSLFRAAEIQMEHMDNRKAALETYLQLLTDYPDSMYAADVRERIQRLRGEGV